MTTIGFRVAERFSPDWGDAWTNYIDWSKLTHLTEVVGLDASLCPSAFGDLVDSDWDHLVFGEEVGHCFDDLTYFLGRITDTFDDTRHQILAVAREASESDLQEVDLPGLRFMGFELIDEKTSTSALTNCGGFEGVFEDSDLSRWGLLRSRSRAHAIREALSALYPKEPHARCAVWAVWRRETA